MPSNADVRAAVAEALGRAAICRTLARALDYPSGAQRADAIARWRALLASEVAWAEGLRAAAATTLADFEAGGEALEPEHVRLFGPAGRAPLVETSWGEAGRLLGRSAALADLGGFYRAFAVAPAAAHPRPEDHLAVELEFLSVLAIKEAWALAEGLGDALAVTREACATFLAEHLGAWVGAWRAAVDGSDPMPVYAALGDTIDRFVRAECARAGVEPRCVAARPPDRAATCEAFTCPLAAGS